MRFFDKILFTLTAVLLCSCMDYGPYDMTPIDIDAPDGIFIVCEGRFYYGTATLSFYDPDSGRVENEVFLRVNGKQLGDVAQSVTVRGRHAWVVVNNSGVIYVIDKDNFRLVKAVRGFMSPRYIHFISDTKAYVTDLYEEYIYIINPSSGQITRKLDTGGHCAERMVAYGDLVFANCWRRDNKILVIDTLADTVIKKIDVGLQPTSLALDKNGRLWTITDGGYSGSSFGREVPALYRIDAATMQVEKSFPFTLGDSPSNVCLNGDGDELYFINKSIWKMDVGAEELPAEPFFSYQGSRYYGLGVNPGNDEVYVADAIDYMQRGMIYRLSPHGTQMDKFRVGITPGGFAFK